MHETIRLIEQVKRRTDIPVFANILADGEDLQSWVALGKAMEEAGADALELNFACPNPKAPSIRHQQVWRCHQPGHATGLLNYSNHDIRVKHSGLAEALRRGNRQCLCGRSGKQSRRDRVRFSLQSPRCVPYRYLSWWPPRIADLIQCSFGGINGPAIREMSSRVIAEVALKLPDLPIIGGGGISDFRHGVEKIMFGASLIFC